MEVRDNRKLTTFEDVLNGDFCQTSTALVVSKINKHKDGHSWFNAIRLADRKDPKVPVGRCWVDPNECVYSVGKVSLLFQDEE